MNDRFPNKHDDITSLPIFVMCTLDYISYLLVRPCLQGATCTVFALLPKDTRNFICGDCNKRVRANTHNHVSFYVSTTEHTSKLSPYNDDSPSMVLSAAGHLPSSGRPSTFRQGTQYVCFKVIASHPCICHHRPSFLHCHLTMLLITPTLITLIV